MEKKDMKVFIIYGKARNGKDTVAGMIEDYYKDKKTINLQISSTLKEYAKKMSDWDGTDNETKPRALLQQLGTEVIRKQIDELFFVKRTIEDLKVYSYFYDVVTISDARLKPEVDMPKKEFDNVYVIKVVRPNFDNGLTEEQKNHITETDLDDYTNYDYEIINDGTLEDLNNKVIEILKEVE